MNIELVCVGDDPLLIESRCAVLRDAGYGAHPLAGRNLAASVRDFAPRLYIVCSSLSEQHRRLLHECIPRNAKTLALDRFTGPEQLLKQVCDALSD